MMYAFTKASFLKLKTHGARYAPVTRSVFLHHNRKVYFYKNRAKNKTVFSQTSLNILQGILLEIRFAV